MLDAKNSISDDSIESVTGGTATGNEGKTVDMVCSRCSERERTKVIRTFDVYLGGRAICRECGWKTQA